MTLRLLALAVTHSRIGCVFLIGDQLVYWRISDRATRSRAKAVAWTQKLIDELRPDVMVTEKPEAASKKGAGTKVLIEAVAAVAPDNDLLGVSVVREQAYANKYEEAEAIAGRYPELEPWVPKKRRFFENEPRNTVIFEAMALALAVLRDPSGRLGAAMG